MNIGLINNLAENCGISGLEANQIKVRKHVELYFKEHLPRYTILEIRRKSYHSADDYLYMVSARKDDGTYSFWSSWNEKLQSLNHGHYDLSSREACDRLFEKYYYKDLQKEII